MNRNNGTSLERRSGTALMKQQETYITPGTDIFETANAFLLKIDMPGAAKESIQIFLDGDLLTVRGSMTKTFGENARLLVREIGRTNYYRIFNLGRGVDREGIDAGYEEGVLTVCVPKSEDGKIREITIQ